MTEHHLYCQAEISKVNVVLSFILEKFLRWSCSSKYVVREGRREDFVSILSNLIIRIEHIRFVLEHMTKSRTHFLSINHLCEHCD